MCVGALLDSCWKACRAEQQSLSCLDMLVSLRCASASCVSTMSRLGKVCGPIKAKHLRLHKDYIIGIKDFKHEATFCNISL